MYLHLGQSVVVADKSVIGVFDLEITSQSKQTRNFLAAAEKSGKVVNISEDLPKSFVLCDNHVYISPLASSTLQKRAASALNFD